MFLVLLLSTILSSTLLTSCTSSDTSTQPNTSTVDSNKPKGIITGRVISYEKSKGVFNISGVRVGIDSTPYFAITDSQGIYRLTAPTGTHILHFTKEGYSDTRIFEIVLFAPDTVTVNYTGIFKEPQQALSNITLINQENLATKGDIIIKGVATPSIPDLKNSYYLLVQFYHRNPEIVKDQMFDEYWFRPIQLNNDFLQLTTPQDVLLKAGRFHANDSVFATVQLVNADGYTNGQYNAQYQDPITGKVYYPGATSPSKVYSFKLF